MSENKDTNWWKIALIAILFIGACAGCFFLGRKTITTEEKIVIKYVETEPIHDTIIKPTVVKVTQPADTANIILACLENGIYSELFPEKIITDTIRFTSEDTLAIISDWASLREYSEQLFNIDTLGTCSINANVQYNRLNLVGYTYKPLQKQIETEKVVKRKISPFIGAGLSVGIDSEQKVSPGIDAQVGLFFEEKYGIDIQAQYMFLNKQELIISGSFLYKF